MVTDPAYATLSPRSRLIATYALCGFSNISSVGIQIGVLSQLAPGQAGRIAEVAVSALISGVISTLTSASIAGMLITDSYIYELDDIMFRCRKDNTGWFCLSCTAGYVFISSENEWRMNG